MNSFSVSVMKMRSGIIGLGLVMFAEGSVMAAEKKPSVQAIQKAIYEAIMKTSREIDTCTSKYLAEFRKNAGEVKMRATIQEDGRVKEVLVTTPLKGARNLRYCLEKVGKSWRFPTLPKGSQPEALTLTVRVKSGTKFSLPKPGEKPPQPSADKSEKDEGFIRFLPESWLPQWSPQPEQ